MLTYLHCSTCNKPITADNWTPLLGHNYHTECLYCNRCNTKLWYKAFVKRQDGKLFCENQCLPQQQQPKLPQNSLLNNETIRQGVVSESLEKFSLPPIKNLISNENNDNENSLDFFLKKPTGAKRKESFLSNSNLNLNKQQTSSSPTRESSRRKDEPFNYNYTEQKLAQPLKTHNKFEPFAYNHNSTGNQDKTNINSNRLMSRGKIQAPFALDIPSAESNDLNSNEINVTCSTCKQLIEENKEKISFNNRFYHRNCFRCVTCLAELYKLKKFTSPINPMDVYCEPCYNLEFSPKCPKCNQPIAAYMLTTLYNQMLYHRECLVCEDFYFYL